MSDSNYHLLSENKTASLLGPNEEELYSVPEENVRTGVRVQNLDTFLVKVYNYFYGKGFLNIFLARFLNLVSLLWVMLLSTYFFTSVDYQILFDTYDLNAATRFTSFPVLWIICLTIFGTFWVTEFISFLRETVSTWEIKQFYERELNINGTDLQTTEWREVVQKIVKVPRLCLAKQDEPLTSLDIANRIMRKDNYMIAMINKDILNLRFWGAQTLTKTAEWSLAFTILNHVFNETYVDGFNPEFLDPANTAQLAQRLRKRFRLMGAISLCLSPFIFIFLIVHFIFQYGEEVKNRPASFAVRQWSPLARWKMRELNELPHVFQKRLSSSYEAAERYVNCFPSQLVATLARFISFIIGSVLAVLIIIGIIDDQALFKMEIWDKTAIWFLGIGGTIVAVCRGLIPPENLVIDPQRAMEEVVCHTHYLPKSWRGRIHTHKVLVEFTSLFQYKFLNWGQELLSVIFVPLILIFTLPYSAEKVIEFFRDCTTYEKGVGYVCKFAIFPLDEVGRSVYSEGGKKGKLKQGKIEKSMLNFKANHPDWKPSQQGEKYMETLNESLATSRMSASTPFNMSENIAMSRMGKDTLNPEESLVAVHRYFYQKGSLPPSFTYSKML